jgi:hypothetical protein
MGIPIVPGGAAEMFRHPVLRPDSSQPVQQGFGPCSLPRQSIEKPKPKEKAAPVQRKRKAASSDS